LVVQQLVFGPVPHGGIVDDTLGVDQRLSLLLYLFKLLEVHVQRCKSWKRRLTLRKLHRHHSIFIHHLHYIGHIGRSFTCSDLLLVHINVVKGEFPEGVTYEITLLALVKSVLID